MDKARLYKIAEGSTKAELFSLYCEQTKVMSEMESQVPCHSGIWQLIKTAPKDETPIDIWCGEEGRRFANYKRVKLGKGNVFYDPVDSGRCCIRTATHWMPKPSAP